MQLIILNVREKNLYETPKCTKKDKMKIAFLTCFTS